MPPARKSKPRSPAEAALGRAVEQLIAERGISQERAAKAAGLDVRQISALVCGQANPAYRTLLRLCDGLRVAPSELMARVEAVGTPVARERHVGRLDVALPSQ